MGTNLNTLGVRNKKYIEAIYGCVSIITRKEGIKKKTYTHTSIKIIYKIYFDYHRNDHS